MNGKFSPVLLIIFLLLSLPGCKDEPQPEPGMLQLSSVRADSKYFDLQGTTEGVVVEPHIFLSFNVPLDTTSARTNTSLRTGGGDPVPSARTFESDHRTIILVPKDPLEHFTGYSIRISEGLKGKSGETFPGVELFFTTRPGSISLAGILINGEDFTGLPFPRNITYQDLQITASFSHPLDPDGIQSRFSLSGGIPVSATLSPDKKIVTIVNASELEDYERYSFSISSYLTAENGYTFDGFTNSFYTALDSSYKFPEVTDEELLDLVQAQTFVYFYDFAHPVSGLARERNTSGDIVTTGGSGFGIMALVVGMERSFITRQQGIEQMDKILAFLEGCDRFHGAWPHWLNGVTGQAIPFTVKDDGADLVETAFLVQGLMTMRQYLDPGAPQEQLLIERIQSLVDAVEWDWFTRGQNVLYWHWSPTFEWQMNMRIQGYNEALIVYVLAASSNTYTIGPEVYHEGYARNGTIVNGNSYYGIPLPLGGAYGGPLFFTHYSHLGLDPRNLQDNYASYWEQGVNMSLINRAHCINNPKDFVGYSGDSWGLTASDNPWGYNAHSPTNDLGVITPTAAVSALPYVPEESMDAIRHFYYILGDRLWGEYGFYDAFSVTEGWWAGSYIAIDQGPIVCMIENHRTGLLWDLFMSAPEVQQGLTKLGFSY